MSAQEKDRVLTSKGYAIKKTALDEIQTQGLRSELTMAPKVLNKFQKMVNNFPIYSESKTQFYVPRHWGLNKFGEPEANIVSQGLPFSNKIAFHNKFPPHDFQTEIIQTFLDKGANGLICVPCGYGKTYMALNIAVRLGTRFLIVVDKEFLMNQWKSEIENFIQHATVGILQSNICQVGSDIIYEKERTLSELKQLAKEHDIKCSGTKQEIVERLQEKGIDTTPKSHRVEYDITICMIQTICRQEYPDGFFDDYGFTIFDECHHLGAAYFCQALKKIQTKYMLGLSATPDREDGLSNVFEYHLGEPVYKLTKRAPDKEAVVKVIWFQSEDPAYSDVPLTMQGDVMTAKLLNQLAEFEPRNQKMVDVIKEYALDSNRFILILSDRISQLEWFENRLKEMMNHNLVGYYIGGMKQSDLDKNAETCQILLATYQMASEAFSVKKLNTVWLATPRKNVEQSTGRIFRQRIDERKVAPHIIDIIDSHETLRRRWYIRQRFYKECEYTFQHVDRPKKLIEKEEEKEEGFLFRFK
jgi:superfamily II DNA or RNA helicase